MKYQLVLQFDASNTADFDQLIEIEDMLENKLGNLHEVDGHDFGSGEMNIFIHTNDPKAAFELAKHSLSASELTTMKAAFRKLDGETYQVLWPESFSGSFAIV